MKHIIFSILFLIPILNFSQDIIATTENGKQVVLKPDNTWEYIEQTANSYCELPSDFEEPKGDSKNQKFLKMADATVDDLKKHISVDRECNIKDIILVEISEQKGNGVYIVCINGEKYKYRRSGSVFYRDGDDPLKLN